MTLSPVMDGTLFRQELFRMLVENSSDIVVQVDDRFRRIYTSPSYQEVLGYSEDEVLGQDAMELVHPDDLVTVHSAAEDFIRHHQRMTCMFRMQHRDGHYIWMEGSYRKLGPGEGSIGLLRDISARRTAEEQLKSSNGILSLILEHINQGICFFDGQTRLLRCNRLYATLYGLPDSLVQPGTELRDILEYRVAHGTGPVKSIDDYIAWRAEMPRRAQPFDSEVALEDGRIIVLHHFPMADGGYVATHEDITGRRRTEEMLREAQKLEAVGRLTGGVAHDFNNILQVIGPALEIACETVEDPALRLALVDAKAAVAHGGQLTRQLLSYARRQMLQPVRTDLRRLVADMAGLLRQACGEAATLLIAEGSGQAAAVIDVAQFRSALLNLVINARDAMPQNREVKGGDGRVCEVRIAVETVDVAVEKSLAAGRYVRVQVSDTGTGIAPADLAHVFEPFFTTKDFGHGSGLGLAQVHGFAHQSGGSVSIESRLGGGTVVVMLLPAAPVEQMPG